VTHDPANQWNRRDLLQGGAFGLAPVALSWMLQQDDVFAEKIKPNLRQQEYSLAEHPSENQPTAKAMISLFMQGGPSHIDLLDPKPELNRLDGRSFRARSSTTTLLRQVHECWVVRGSSGSTANVARLFPNYCLA